jgi:hypothetical protein
MFAFVIILAVMSTTLELMIAAKIPAWRRLSHKSKLFNLLNSLFISYIMGIAFGAAGLIAMTAGVISTLLSVPGYALLNWAYESPQAQAHGGNLFTYYKDRWKTAITDLVNLIYKIIKIITFPIWATRAAMNKVNSIRKTATP